MLTDLTMGTQLRDIDLNGLPCLKAGTLCPQIPIQVFSRRKGDLPDDTSSLMQRACHVRNEGI